MRTARVLASRVLGPRFRLTALAFAALPLAASPARAAEESLPLGKAIQHALAGNADLKRERIAIETAEGRAESARGFFDLTLTGGLEFAQSVRPAVSADDFRAGTSNTVSGNLGIARELESGGQLSLGISTTRTKADSPLDCGTFATRETCSIYETNFGVALEQPLLRGFGPGFALANVRRTRIAKDQSLLNRQMRASLVLRDVINTYWSLAYATQDLAIRRSGVDLAKEQLRVTQAQIEVGRSAPVDAAAVERAIGERQQEVVLAEQEVLFRSLELRRFFGGAIKPTDPTFVAADAPQAQAASPDANGEINRALEANPQLRSLKLGQQLTDIDIAVARSSLLPQLDLLGEIGAGGRKRDLGASFSQTFEFEARAWSVGLRFAFPVPNRVAGGQERVARAAGELSALNAADYENELRYQVQRFVSNITTASKRLELAKATVGFANQNLEAEKARFSVGRSTNNEVLRVQQELKNAEVQVVRATVDVLLAQTSLAALTGDLLEHHRITLKD